MERLTFVDEKGNVLFTPKGCDEDVGYTITQLSDGGHIDLLNDIACRLANHEQMLKHYDDLEEYGLLLRVPCKVGDTAWYVNIDYDDYPIEIRITDIKINEHYIHYRAEEKEDCGTLEFDSDDFGKNIFFTKAEAEQKLKEMESD